MKNRTKSIAAASGLYYNTTVMLFSYTGRPFSAIEHSNTRRANQDYGIPTPMRTKEILKVASNIEVYKHLAVTSSSTIFLVENPSVTTVLTITR